jgi:hypothetical protein
MKNLLHLGEDQYLTTLRLKHCPLFKTQFIRDAHAFTGRLEGFTIPASTLDQLYSSQSGRTRFLGAALWLLLFLDAFHSCD